MMPRREAGVARFRPLHGSDASGPRCAGSDEELCPGPILPLRAPPLCQHSEYCLHQPHLVPWCSYQIGREKIMANQPAVAYYRTSSAANVGADKDSVQRQRDAVTTSAKGHGLEIVREFRDAAVSGADPIDRRPG